MKNQKTTIAMIAFMALTVFGSFAQQIDPDTKKNKISIEIDPATFAFNGYGIHFRLQPKNSEHLLIGLGTYAMDMPDVIVGLNKENKDEGWKSRLNQGVGFFAEHHFDQVNSKWFIGGQTSIQQYKITNENIAGSEKHSNLLLMGYAGYTWKPFAFNMYIKPWAGIGYTTKIAGENKLGTETYDISPILMFATLHVGYTF